MIEKTFIKNIPTTTQNIQPGLEEKMNPQPIYDHEEYRVYGNRLKNKVAIITGGDSGIGRAVALAYSREGAKVAIIYFNEDIDAEKTKDLITSNGGQCVLIRGDISDESFCLKAIKIVVDTYSKIDILVNNAGEQHVTENFQDITVEQLDKTFKTNFYGAFFMAKGVMPYLKEGSSIIITTSVTAYQGNEKLIDYSATKGALSAFTRSLALNVASKGIRVNAVAPGPIWTPLIPSTFSTQDLGKFGDKTALKRPGQPVEVAEAYVFLASQGGSYITGETIHVNGGEIVNG